MHIIRTFTIITGIALAFTACNTPQEPVQPKTDCTLTVSLSSSDADNAVITGESVTFTATAPGANTFAFAVDGVVKQQGNSQQFTVVLANGQKVGVRATDAQGCQASSPEISTVVSEPVAGTDPGEPTNPTTPTNPTNPGQPTDPGTGSTESCVSDIEKVLVGNTWDFDDRNANLNFNAEGRVAMYEGVANLHISYFKVLSCDRIHFDQINSNLALEGTFGFELAADKQSFKIYDPEYPADFVTLIRRAID
jgi:hypothetical protein